MMRTPRKYIAPSTMQRIKFDLDRLFAERDRNGQPPPPSYLIAEWTGYSKAAIVRARREIGR